MSKNRQFSPFEWIKGGYPSPEKFEVCRDAEGKGNGVRTLIPISRGHLVSHMVGILSGQRELHTLQVSETTHLYDPYFSGLLLHACSPSVVLDMKRLEVFALRDIEAGEFLTMDYASTEDVLARQFRCQCHAANCRHWITGAREVPNDEGTAYLASVACLAKLTVAA